MSNLFAAAAAAVLLIDGHDGKTYVLTGPRAKRTSRRPTPFGDGRAPDPVR
jgi:hypothetical protein